MGSDSKVIADDKTLSEFHADLFSDLPDNGKLKQKPWTFSKLL
jgi:hypothetical protein